MKSKAMKWMIKLGGVAASFAALLTVGNVSRGCWFMLYQPEVPEELK